MPPPPDHVFYNAKDVSIGVAGTYEGDQAELTATALVGKKSLARLCTGWQPPSPFVFDVNRLSGFAPFFAARFLPSIDISISLWPDAALRFLLFGAVASIARLCFSADIRSTTFVAVVGAWCPI